MAVTSAGTGTQTATLTTEHELLSINTAGVYIINVDCSLMQAGDITELRVYQIAITGGTEQEVLYGRFEGAQIEKMKKSIPVSNALTDSGSVRFTLKQLVGTGRNYYWSVVKHA
jgi:hypothetical protein